MNPIQPGIFLISDPFLNDPNFRRTVILLCDHSDEGSVGFVLNKHMNLSLQDVLQDAEGLNWPLYEGGPVQQDTLHFLHRRPDLVEGSMEITKDIYWGGDFPQVLELLNQEAFGKDDIRFFVGYSGWSKDQLENELNEKSWITRDALTPLVFTHDTQRIWPASLSDLGGEYSRMVHYPIDPQLN